MAAVVAEELKLTVTPPAGAAADKVRVRFCGPEPATMLRLFGVKLTVAFTWTAVVPDV